MYGFAFQAAVYERRGCQGTARGAAPALLTPRQPVVRMSAESRSQYVTRRSPKHFTNSPRRTKVTEGQKSQPDWHGRKTRRLGEGC